MASLADLFDTSYVVYQSVNPSAKTKQNTEQETDKEDTISRLYKELGAARQRISNLEEAASSKPEEPGEPEEPEEPSEGDDDKSVEETPADSNSPSSPAVVSTAADNDFIDRLTNVLKGAGIKFRITSGLDTTRENPNSYHRTGDAMDIVPDTENPTPKDFEELLDSLLSSNSVRNFFANNNIGLYDERTQRSSSSKWTGPHFHIGPDNVALADWKLFLENFNREHGDAESEEYNTPAPESDENIGTLTYDEKEKTRVVYNKMLEELGKKMDASDADILARWYTAQWATDHDFSTRFKGFKTHYWSGYDENSGKEPSVKLDLTYEFPERSRVKQYVAELLMQNKNLEDIESLDEFISSISNGDDKYKDKYILNLRRINKYLGAVKSSRQGGKFMKIRDLYGKSFSQYR